MIGIVLSNCFHWYIIHAFRMFLITSNAIPEPCTSFQKYRGVKLQIRFSQIDEKHNIGFWKYCDDIYMENCKRQCLRPIANETTNFIFLYTVSGFSFGCVFFLLFFFNAISDHELCMLNVKIDLCYVLYNYRDVILCFLFYR